ncbi:MAG: RidA family protein [Ignavibacteriaceae bacterium]|jgi:enamine deaminase RidA (YjgF/YER057c/UK114 family)
MVEDKIKELGLQLPEAPKPLAAYVSAVKVDNLVFTSGQLPIENGVLKIKGKIGSQLNEEEGIKAAEICTLNCLSVIKGVIGSLDKIEQVVKLTAFVNCADYFTSQPKIANGASELLVKIFGDKGKHARSAIGVSELPLDAPVEIEMLVKVKN